MRLIAAALAAALLASPAETAESGPGPRIDWRRDALRGVFDAAAADGKPIVVVTEGDEGRFFANSLRCPRFDSLADAAHFVLIKLPVEDESEAGRLVNALRLDPAYASGLVVLRTTARPFVEVARLRGAANEATLLATMAEAGLSPEGDAVLDAAVGDEPGGACVK